MRGIFKHDVTLWLRAYTVCVVIHMSLFLRAFHFPHYEATHVLGPQKGKFFLATQWIPVATRHTTWCIETGVCCAACHAINEPTHSTTSFYKLYFSDCCISQRTETNTHTRFPQVISDLCMCIFFCFNSRHTCESIPNMQHSHMNVFIGVYLL